MAAQEKLDIETKLDEAIKTERAMVEDRRAALKHAPGADENTPKA